MSTAAIGSRAWLPNVDYLIDATAHTKAYCCYCFRETEWTGYARALNEILEHLDAEHIDRRPLRMPR